MIDLQRLERIARRATVSGPLRGTNSRPGRRRGRRRPQGLSFAGHRDYQFGDDVRHMDWKVTARIGRPFAKVFQQAPAGTVLVLADASASMTVAARTAGTPPAALEVAALVALIAAHNDERIGLAQFTDRLEWTSPFGHGRHHALASIRAMERARPTSPRTSLALGLDAAMRLVRPPATLVVVSDFIDRDYEAAIRRARRRHHLVTVCLVWPEAAHAVAPGLGRVRDPETGRVRWLDMHDRRVVAGIETARRRFASDRRRLFSVLDVPHIEVPVAGSWADAAQRVGALL